MKLQQLVYVTKVAECGSITEAARRLYVSQPSITSAIHDLEQEMNVHIFDRTNKGVVVSEEGETFLGYARQVLEQTELLEGKYKNPAQRVPHFSVSCQHYSFAVNAFVDVIREFDAARYDFTLREEQTHEIIEDVAHMKSELGVALNNAAIEGAPEDLVINTHVCRGNYHSTYAFEGGYDPVAPYLFAHENVNAFYLEFDTPRAGGFEPLAHVAEGKKVVLGLITSKQPGLEDKEVVKARIKEASKYVPLENLYLSPQCGFASCEIGNKLTEEEQWAKIALIQEIAAEVWGE